MDCGTVARPYASLCRTKIPRQSARFVRCGADRTKAGQVPVIGAGGARDALIVGTPALTSNPFVVGVAFFVGGVTIVVWNVVTVSLRQRITPDRLLGRVNSGYRLVAWGTMPLGAAVGGIPAQLVGLRAVFAMMAALSLAMVIVMRRLTDSAIDAAERAANSGEIG